MMLVLHQGGSTMGSLNHYKHSVIFGTMVGAAMTLTSGSALACGEDGTAPSDHEYTIEMVKDADILHPDTMKIIGNGKTKILKSDGTQTLEQNLGVRCHRPNIYEMSVLKADFEKAIDATGIVYINVDPAYREQPEQPRACMMVPIKNLKISDVSVSFTINEDPSMQSERYKILDQTDKNPNKYDQVWCYAFKPG
jgi:hypothetical protein